MQQRPTVSSTLLLSDDVHTDDHTHVHPLEFLLSMKSNCTDEVLFDETAKGEGVG